MTQSSWSGGRSYRTFHSVAHNYYYCVLRDKRIDTLICCVKLYLYWTLFIHELVYRQRRVELRNKTLYIYIYIVLYSVYSDQFVEGHHKAIILIRLYMSCIKLGFILWVGLLGTKWIILFFFFFVFIICNSMGLDIDLATCHPYVTLISQIYASFVVTRYLLAHLEILNRWAPFAMNATCLTNQK